VPSWLSRKKSFSFFFFSFLIKHEKMLRQSVTVAIKLKSVKTGVIKAIGSLAKLCIGT